MKPEQSLGSDSFVNRPTILKDEPECSLTVEMSSYENGGTVNGMSTTGKEQIFIYDEEVKFLLKSYGTHFVTANGKYRSFFLRMTSMEVSVQFVNILCTKFVQCEIARSKERTNNVFIDGPPSTYKVQQKRSEGANKMHSF